MANKKLVRVLDIEELKSEMMSHRQSVDRLQSRWSLGLAIANGAALAALSGQVLSDISAPTLPLLFPSLWIFATGLVLSGMVPLHDLLMADRAYRGAARLLSAMSDDPTLEPSAEMNDDGIALNFGWILEIGAGASFLVGIAYPLTVLSIRYCTHGTFLAS